MSIGKRRDRQAVDEFHHEVGALIGCDASVEDRRDVRVIQHGEGLTLGFEPRENLSRITAGLDHLQGDDPADGRLLLRAPDDAHSAFPDRFNQAVGAKPGPGRIRHARFR